MDISKLSHSDIRFEQPYKIFKADSGGITFVMFKRTRLLNCDIKFIGKECPHRTLYEMKVNSYGPSITLRINGGESKQVDFPSELTYYNESKRFWLSWYNDTIEMGVKESGNHQKPFLVFKDLHLELNTEHKQLIGFIKVPNNLNINFFYEGSTVFLKPVSYKNVDEGQLKWVKMTDNELPEDALIGGFEDEPLYIARARHNGSLCPGKYVPSKKEAFLPWGHIEHRKAEFEILCGFNALWVKCKDNKVPENVFKAGTSEVRGEDMYIGRAMIGDDLVVGKVHMLYSTCYLPYKGKEVEMRTYEILVRGDKRPYGITTINNCPFNPYKALQPCI